MIGFDWPPALTALPLALIPLFTRWLLPQALPAPGAGPGRRRWHPAVYALNLAGVLGIAGFIIGASGPFLRGGEVPREGKGANMVLLIDRSSSMDDSFAGRRPGGGEDSKSEAARRILLEFIAGRADDRVGVAAFSTSPLMVLPLTDSRSALRAAIAAQGEAGLSQTDVGRGLALAMDMLKDAPQPGARAVVMVSDGAAVIAPEVQKQLRELAAAREVSLYWLYLRTKGARSIFDDGAPGERNTPQTRPERHLHLYLQRLGVPYHAWEAEDAGAVSAALEEVNRLEQHRLVTTSRIPRRDLSAWAFALAGLAALLLTLARLIEIPLRREGPAALVRWS